MITENFEKWLVSQKINKLDFENMIWEMKWGVYQKYFWENEKWWLSIYPYTDKFGGKVESFWDNVHLNIHFITNNPEQAQKKLVEKAFKLKNK